eukprot:TRINITY_DN51202_c0_g1_i1.p1 TRINITY_DN51202_c0_g1~~TRINITY_DN51202_c0_g1_i1.p1  ORF type:complete len:698 (+),score=276.46 TRINITY_DN51202_c0_g1_i1:105-2096(+)
MPSKAQKKAEEEERRQKELREKAAGIAKKLYDQHERERVTTEKTEKDWRQQEHVKLLVERERLDDEKKKYSAIGSDKAHRVELCLKDWRKLENWHNIVVDSWLPDVNSEADINAFLTVWEEDDNSGGEGSKRNLDKDFELILEAYKLAEEILEAQDGCAVATGGRAGEAARRKAAWHRRNLLNVYNMIQTKLDQLTANVLHYLDQYVDREDEIGMTLCKENPVVRYGLWAGGQTRPRHRSVEYNDIGVSVQPKEGAYLPNALGLAQGSRGIRVIQLHYDPMTLRSFEDDRTADEGAEYCALGCVFFVEVLQYPKPPDHVGQWTVRMETKLAHNIRRHPYPPPPKADADPAEMPKPIKISFIVPERVVVRHRAPFIGIWSQDERRWRPEGTSEYDYKRDERKASFATQYLACMAIIQEKGFDVPYETWQLIPRDDDEVLLVIEGKRRGEISDREVHIQIRENRCRLVEPAEPELEYLRTQWYHPASFLRKLAQSAYVFVFSDGDAKYFPDIVPKTQALETKVYEDIAHFCTVHAFSSSRHNAARLGVQSGNAPEDPTMALFRISKEARAEGGGTPFTRSDPDDESKWNCIRYEEHRCAFCNCKESADAADLQDAEGQLTHLNLYMALSAAGSPEEVRRRYDNGNLLLHQAVKEILCLTRPLSFG